ncbi:2,5-diamino-6-(ribosylamino)-4(3H)-pyrimidinone 5'-phosphate reductase [Tulasnella sp. 424]|nr:2,5-diamino-6-(ribosylamino)-4(3H)-pyrimidinone 5'-phosphate reductase [Tulasnella sp. 424]KAG8966150.1 2,5-diamino-6-(ribosylamino)-4(3H)-pyrimidinone 5'-phosphate reductase [Tulasnella sp. 425]
MASSAATTDPESFLKAVLNHVSGSISPPENRPFVTLTYAQSLDGKIAGKGGKQLILTRRLPVLEEPYPQPIPIILDSQLRFKPDCKLVKNFASGNGRQPWVLCSEGADSTKREGLQNAGVNVVSVKSNDETGKLDIDNVLSTLSKLGIKSLMVEGGQKVISSFLSHKSASTGGSVVDSIIVTVAPT